MTPKSAIDILRIAKTYREADAVPHFQYKEKKYDGWFLIGVNTGDGTIYFTRRMNEVRHPTLHALPPNTLIAGEFYVPGRDATQVTTAVAEQSLAEFRVFAVHRAGGEICESFAHRDELIDRIGYQPVESFFGILPDFFPEGFDGVVLKSVHWPERPGDWARYKPRATVDLRYLGWNPSTSDTNFGTLASINVESDDGNIKAKCDGMNQQQRAEFLSGEIPIGSIVEISYQKILSRGGLREPKLLRVRYDKDTTTTKEQLR